jgi:membrane protease YdiL (CAAX protease family)
MLSGILMSLDTSARKVEDGSGPSRLLAIATASEVSLLLAGILTYIWHWQHTNPRVWIVLFALILASHALHRDTLRGLGLGGNALRASAQWVLPLAALLYLPMLFYGFIHHYLEFLRPTWQSLLLLLGYGCWCAFQQYLTQSYFHNRLMLVIRNRHVSSALVGIMFSATHIPNLILMVATLIAGFVFAEVFSRYRNIWPLALAQAVGGLLLAAVAPDALIHHMRVGPGYFFYGIR